MPSRALQMKGSLKVADAAMGDAVSTYALTGGAQTKLRSLKEARKYFESLCGSVQLDDIRVNGHPLDVNELKRLRSQGAVLQVTAVQAATTAVDGLLSADDVAGDVSMVDAALPATETTTVSMRVPGDDASSMTPFQRMASVSPSQWIY